MRKRHFVASLNRDVDHMVMHVDHMVMLCGLEQPISAEVDAIIRKALLDYKLYDDAEAHIRRVLKLGPMPKAKSV